MNMLNIYSCCRLCLKQSVNGAVNCTEIEELSNSIENVFGFKISTADGCSTKVCRDCICKVTSYSMYRNGVLNNQKSIQQYKTLQEKIGFSVEIKQEDEDDDVIIITEEISKLPPEPKDKPLSVSKYFQEISNGRKIYAKKSTAKPTIAPIKNIKKKKKLKKCKVVCHKLKESDILSVILKDEDKKILNLNGKPQEPLQNELEEIKKSPPEANPVNSVNENQAIISNVISQPDLSDGSYRQYKSPGLVQVTIIGKSKKVPTVGNSIETPPVQMKTNNKLETVVGTPLNRPFLPSSLPNTPKLGWQTNIITSQVSLPSPTGLLYVNSSPITTKPNTFTPILPKPPKLPVVQIAEKISTNTSTIINTTGSSTTPKTSISSHLPVITEVFNNFQNISTLVPSCTVKRIMPTQNTYQYFSNNDNTLYGNNIAFSGANLAPGNSPAQYSTSNSHPSGRTYQNPPNTVLVQRPIDKIGSVVTSSTQINHVPTPADEYIPVELFMQQQNRQISQINSKQGPIKMTLQTRPEVKIISRPNMELDADHVTSTIVETQPINEKRVKVLSVNELNMRASEVSLVESRKLPIRITLVKIRNEVQIKLTDSKGKEIHYTNLAPQEQSAVRCSLLQPASREQILNAIRTCMPDKYSQDMLKTLGIAIRGNTNEV